MNEKKIELVHIVESLGGGGLERRMLECVKGLSKDVRYSQHVILLYDKIDYTDIYDTKAELIVLRNKSRIKKSFELINRIRTIQPDLVHLWTGSFMTIPVYYRKASLGYKIIAGFIADGNPIASSLRRMVWNYYFKSADIIVSNSKAGLIAKQAPIEKSIVVYNGFSFDRFKNFSSYDKSLIKAEFGIRTKYVVSMSGRFMLAKDWDTYLEIVEEVEKVRQDVTFLAVGQGELLQHYEDVAMKAGTKKIIFTGFRKDIDKIYFISDICVLCTNEKVHAEGVSNAIMEAMAAGKPVIATLGGGTPEIIEDGKNGYIISPHDAEAGSELIKELLNDEAIIKSIGLSAKHTIRSKFNIDKMILSYKKLYDDLMTRV